MKMAIDFKNQIPVLIELQKVDDEINTLVKEKESRPRELEEFSIKIEEKKSEIASKEQEIKDTRLKIKEKELELKSAEEGIGKLQQQLLQVKTNKEYKALLNEIAGKKADNSLIEDTILDLMENLDGKEVSLNKEKEELKVLQQEYKKEEERINKEIKELEARIKDKQSQRKEIAAKVDSGLLSIYNRLLKSKDNLAIVPVVDDACGGCHLSLRPQVINEIKKYNRLVTCERCSRILYLDE